MMTDPSIIDDLAASIARHTARRIPLAVDLWGYAEICKTGPDGVLVREGRTHATKKAAAAWAELREAEIEGGAAVLSSRLTFGELMERYAAEVSPTKAGFRWEQIRIAALSDDPISAVRQLESVRDGDSVLRVIASSIDVLFRKARDKAGVVGLTFHDSRHLAITRLAKVLDVLPLAKAIGHRDLRMLMIYYNPSAEDLAKKLP